MARSTNATKNIPVYGHPALGFKDGPIRPYRYVVDTFQGWGQDSFSIPPAQDPEMFQKLSNCLVSETGVILPRWGSTIFSTVLANLMSFPFHLWSYEHSNGTRAILATDGTHFYAVNDITGALVAATPFGMSHDNYVVISRDYAYFAGDQRKWIITAPSSSSFMGTGTAGAKPTFVTAAGSVTVTTERRYFYVYKNTSTGHISDLSPVSDSTGPLTSQQVTVTVSGSADPQIDVITLLATADGGAETTLYFVGETAAVAFPATTTIVDNVPEATLLVNQVYLSTDSAGQEFGVTDNVAPPANGTYCIKHKGRLYLAVGRLVYFSKAIDELTTATGFIAGKYEESWPPSFFFDIAEGAEVVKGFLSYGDLFIASERTIRRLAGSGPNDFAKPEVVFNDVGVASQETWKAVFLEGTPIGAMWLTPDNRVMISDFNTYRDVGTPIQDILSTINSAAIQNSTAAYLHIGAYSFYMLAIPTGVNTVPDTLLVYNIRNQRWSTWDVQGHKFYGFLQHIPSSGTPMALFVDDLFDARLLKQFTPSSIQDQLSITPTYGTFTETVNTSWLDLNDPSLIKSLNEIEIAATTGGWSVTLIGANNQDQLVNGTYDTLVNFAAPVAAPILTNAGGLQKVYLATAAAKHRWFKLGFSSPTGGQFNAFILHVIPLMRF